MKPVLGLGGDRKLIGYCYGKFKRGVGTRIRPPYNQELESPSSPPTNSLKAVQKPGEEFGTFATRGVQNREVFRAEGCEHGRKVGGVFSMFRLQVYEFFYLWSR